MDVSLALTFIDNATKGILGVSDGLKKVDENARNAETRLRAIQVVFANIAIEKSVEWGRKILDAMAAAEKTTVMLSRFTGGITQANAAWSKFSKDLSGTGLGMSALADALARISINGGDPQKNIAFVESIGKAVTAMGGGDTELKNMATSMETMLGRGTVQWRALTATITDAGISLKDLAAAHYADQITSGMMKLTDATTAYEKSVKEGFLSSTTFVGDFENAVQKKFGNIGTLMGSTIKGAMGNLQDAWNNGWKKLSQNTNINQQIVVIIDRISQGIEKFFDGIDQSKLDSFNGLFITIQNSVDAAGKIADQLLTILKIMGDIAAVVPPDSIELGLIGRTLFGRSGFAIGYLIGWIAEKIQGMAEAFKQMANGTYKIHLTDEGIDPITGAPKPSPGMPGITDPAAMARVKANQDELFSRIAQITMGNSGPSAQMSAAIEASQSMRRSVADTLAAIGASTGQSMYASMGDTIDAEIQKIKKQSLETVKTLNGELAKLQADKLGQDKNLEAAVNGEIIRANQARDMAIAKVIRLNALATETLRLEQGIAQISLGETIRGLNNQNNSGAIFNLLQGTSGGQLENSALQQKATLQANILQYQMAIAKAKEDEIGKDEVTRASIQATIDLYNEAIQKSQEALTKVSASGQAANEMWKSLGQTIESGVTDAITGLIEGTKSFGDVMRSVFHSIDQIMIHYIEQLIEAQFLQSKVGAGGGGAGGGGGGGFLSALFAAIFSSGGGSTAAEAGSAAIADVMMAANGAAFSGKVKPFATGDIIGGPTLFGLAGEAGTEAIMPLTRIGGKLGVHTSGGGGNSYNITIQAIDTQTGLQFIHQHMDAIDKNLSQRKLLNRHRSFNGA